MMGNWQKNTLHQHDNKGTGWLIVRHMHAKAGRTGAGGQVCAETKN